MDTRFLKKVKEKTPNILEKTANVALNSGQTAAIAVAAFMPLDMVMHRLHAKKSQPSVPRVTSSNSRVQVVGAAFHATLRMAPQLYVNGLQSGVTKISLKHGSELASGKVDGAKSTDIKSDSGANIKYDAIKPAKKEGEAARSEKAIDETTLNQNEVQQRRSLRETAFPVAMSVGFGVIETLFTQSPAVRQVHAKERVMQAALGVEYKMPEWTTGSSGLYKRISTAFLPRASRNASVLVAYQSTEYTKQKYKEHGFTDMQARCLAIGTTATTFGVAINTMDLTFMRQVVSGKSMFATLSSIKAESGWRGFLAGAAGSVIYTGYANWMVPFVIEPFVFGNLVPAEKKKFADILCAARTGFGFFTAAKPVDTSQQSVVVKAEQAAENTDQITKPKR